MAVTPSGFTLYRHDRTADSGKRRGRGVCVMLNSLWATDVAVLASHCSTVLEQLTVKIRPFFLPREFTAVVMSAVYTPPQADKAAALDDLYGIINGLENVHPETAFIVVGDFNRANMKSCPSTISILTSSHVETRSLTIVIQHSRAVTNPSPALFW